MTPQQQAEKVAREWVRGCLGTQYGDELIQNLTDTLLTFESERLRMAKEALKNLVTDIETDGGIDTSCWPLLDEAQSTLELLNGKDGE